MKKVCIALLLLSSLASVSTVLAAPYEPIYGSEVVASWNPKSNPSNEGLLNSLEQLSWLLEEGQRPGAGNIYIKKAEEILNAYSLESQDEPEFLYLKARLQQHKHEFDDALITLEKLLRENERSGNAWILKASIHAIKGEYDLAKKSCNKTFDTVPSPVVIACLLDVSGLESGSENTYQLLSRMAREVTSFDVYSEAWLREILADQAISMGRFKEASDWLSKHKMYANKLSALILWSDANLNIGNFQLVYQELSEQVKALDYLDDALLISLSRAEKMIGGSVWQNRAKQRIELRLAREDNTHLAEIAQYFIYISPDREKAIYWAEKNWSESKLDSDRRTLELAKSMEGVIS